MAMATEKRLVDANEYPCKDCGKTYCHQNCEKFIAWLGNAVDAVEVVHGRWKAYKPEERGYAFGFVCSNCCEITYLDYAQKECDYNYCPNCGADMRERRTDG